MSAREIFLAVKDAFQHEFGNKQKQRNPWPKCLRCYHRRAPHDFCPKCMGRTCLACCPFGGPREHPKPKTEDNQ